MSFDAMARAMEIAADRGSGAPFVIYNDLPDLEAAYRVQSALSRVEGGVGGYKIAWNSPALMAAHGVSAPAAARVRRALIRPDGAQVSADEFVTPMLEPEIAIVLGEDMPEGPHDADSVVRYVRRMVPAFELLDRREAKERHAPSIIASGVFNAGLVLGTGTGSEIGGSSVKVGSARYLSGEGKPPQHPYEALAHVANTLQPHGAEFRAGMIVLCGSHTPLLPVSVGETAEMVVEGLGSVRFDFV
ncbi:2-keto-4-pentenoate hydratase [Pontivivens insulae]|uniref:2-oxo-hept-4-ene-1,7-dioate hydratase n=1 Tax=Pontivivens insulae TaxID=1639689 RepID=A0A2R8A9M3_9RHOB|nr:hypothetical protein [Pontivivens insulae]RED12833.1 2-keto-4-pentenoate hydratase [Pontivivens insulae]SPF28924.1 2-oxo-hept-4-ene-1,7-dioate hydratase [Pontivivens insulae]